MKHEEFNWTGTDNLNIFARHWQPDTPATGVICLVHGMGEHSGRYHHLAEFFTKHGYAIMAFDHRGHGKSEGEKGHVDSYDTLLNQVDHLLEKAEKQYPDLPIFIYGHSMGGNVVINHAIRRKPIVNGIISTGPWLRLGFAPPKAKMMLGKLVKKIYPKFTEDNNLDANQLSHDKEVVQAYIDDPLVHGKISTGFFFGVNEAGEWAIKHGHRLGVPMLLMHGGEDKITSPEATKEFAKQSEHKITLKIWEKLYHEIHNEPEQDQVFNYTLEWMKNLQ